MSLFSGAGGMDLGLHAAGIETVAMCEIDPHARSVLAKHWPGVPITEDVRDVGSEWRGVDLVHGGFPCQDISVAGHRKGLDGERSGLWWEFHRILAELRPTWCIIENVAGLLSSNDGRDLGAILGALGDIGYGWAFRVLDARLTGRPRVPQRRRRVFIVGHLGGTGGAQVLLEPEGVRWDLEAGGEAGPGAAGTLDGGSGGRGWAPDTDRMTFVPARTGTVTANWSKGPGNCQVESGLVMAVSDLAVRRLTPRECERLMGWPDDHTRWGSDGKEIADTHRYRLCGNGVVAPVAEWIGTRILNRMVDDDSVDE